MSFLGAKSHRFIVTAILLSAVMFCWRAEAGPRFGPRPIVQRVTVVTKITRESNGHTACRVYNTSPKFACVLYDVNPIYSPFSPPKPGWSAAVMFPTSWLTIADAWNYKPLQCKLRYARSYPLYPCPTPP